jgi:prepilin peptidase CpaA
MALVALLMTTVVLGVTIQSCITDARSLNIPNWHTLVILACFIPAFLAMPSAFAGGLIPHLEAMAIVFVVTYLLFFLGLLGGGDSKLGTGLGLWIGLKGLVYFLFYMSIAGGLLGVAALYIRKHKIFKNPAAGSWVAQLQNGRNAMPYGIAISFGAWMTFIQTGFLHNQLSEVFKIIH